MNAKPRGCTEVLGESGWIDIPSAEHKTTGGFSSNTEVAKGATLEQCKAISTRSGKILMTPNQNKQRDKTVDNPNAATVPDEPAPTNAPAAVHINLPLVEALQQMSNYAKFLKDMLSRKARIGEFETNAADHDAQQGARQENRSWELYHTMLHWK
ncbi:hypothetical protein V6N11_081974 [Hibiscus sabdariffa]|uniref:Uncharacterized protein n=1 Tax=Hibiscus sabdariffa TaxID=183260 RepID=A0ABR2NWY4_9ROSI